MLGCSSYYLLSRAASYVGSYPCVIITLILTYLLTVSNTFITAIPYHCCQYPPALSPLVELSTVYPHTLKLCCL
ncbi:hypothetical protein BDQ94DRAFT_153616 [Aspergillus welwitschiae]|uniref:Uncharacterized protein n=1 Tax=Aspergillus welwitschiae TaxID=1341132 RepID=A0A3F3PL48_9EURO|nr:hypothetical protein BDQ94DRAFT_153616 [Aspergillus welwitschiae]RDH27654.1 hypothetical protein BDQ94DRAFT_153616 [Aspergillus welwitschiae]